jgi:hypothetical protein
VAESPFVVDRHDRRAGGVLDGLDDRPDRVAGDGVTRVVVDSP